MKLKAKKSKLIKMILLLTEDHNKGMDGRTAGAMGQLLWIRRWMAAAPAIPFGCSAQRASVLTFSR
jgi:hypothetical protein